MVMNVQIQVEHILRSIDRSSFCLAPLGRPDLRGIMFVMVVSIKNSFAVYEMNITDYF